MSKPDEAPDTEAVNLGNPLAAEILRAVSPQEVEQLRKVLRGLQSACDLALARHQAGRPPGEAVATPTSWAELGEMVALLLEHLPEDDAEPVRRAGPFLFRGFRLYLGTLVREGETSRGETRKAPEEFDEGRILREAFLAHLAPEEAESLRRVGALIFPMCFEGTAGGPASVAHYLRGATDDLRHTARFLEWLTRGEGKLFAEETEEMRALVTAADLSRDLFQLADALAAAVPPTGAGSAAGGGEEG